MKWSDLPLAPSTRMLRQFAGMWLVVLAALACWHGLIGQRLLLSAVLGVVAVAVGLLGLIRPAVLRPIFVGLIVLTFPLGWVVSRVVLTAIFFGIVTPLAIGLRLARRDSLVLRRPVDRDSYWEPRPPPTGARSYLQQF